MGIIRKQKFYKVYVELAKDHSEVTLKYDDYDLAKHDDSVLKGLRPLLTYGVPVSLLGQSEPYRLPKNILPIPGRYTLDKRLRLSSSQFPSVLRAKDVQIDPTLVRIVLKYLLAQNSEYSDAQACLLLYNIWRLLCPSVVEEIMGLDIPVDKVVALTSTRSSNRRRIRSRIKYISWVEDAPNPEIAEKTLCVLHSPTILSKDYSFTTHCYSEEHGTNPIICDPKYITDLIYRWVCESLPEYPNIFGSEAYYFLPSNMCFGEDISDIIEVNHEQALALPILTHSCPQCKENRVISSPEGSSTKSCRVCGSVPSMHDKMVFHDRQVYANRPERDQTFLMALSDIASYIPAEPIKVASLPSIASFDCDVIRLNNAAGIRFKEFQWYELPRKVDKTHEEIVRYLRSKGVPVTVHEEDILESKMVKGARFLNLDFCGVMTDERDLGVRELLLRCLPDTGYITALINFNTRLEGGIGRYKGHFSAWPDFFEKKGAHVELMNHYTYSGQGTMLLTSIALASRKE